MIAGKDRPLKLLPCHGASGSTRLFGARKIPRRPLVLLRITDSNKGNYQSLERYDELEYIFGHYDAYGYKILAMWTPRKENILFLRVLILRKNALTQLKFYARMTVLVWLPDSDTYHPKLTVAALVYSELTPSRAKFPATLDVLERVVCSLDMSSPWEHAMATNILLDHNALLRGEELHNRLKVRDPS